MEKLSTKRESGISRVMGPEEEFFLRHFKEKFNQAQWLGAELEKTPESRELIEEVNKYLRSFLKNYNIESLNLRPEHVHFLLNLTTI